MIVVSMEYATGVQLILFDVIYATSCNIDLNSVISNRLCEASLSGNPLLVNPSFILPLGLVAKISI